MKTLSGFPIDIFISGTEFGQNRGNENDSSPISQSKTLIRNEIIKIPNDIIE